MRLLFRLTVVGSLLLFPRLLHAQAETQGTVTGLVTDASTRAPLEDVRVVLRSGTDSTRVATTATGKDGAFTFGRVPRGTYVVECSVIGHVSFRTEVFTLGPERPSVKLPTITLKPAALLLAEVQVSAEKKLFNNATDRRVYNVAHDVMVNSSTASDLLQNIPSVQVDLDGNVSLRGSSDVTILVNGKKSPLMGKSRADVLQQLPAANIERIEVITNPSARYTPEGTAGIINLVMKKGTGRSLSGDATVHAGASGRNNENISLSGHPGKLELFGNYSFRDDRRLRFGSDDRVLGVAGATGTYREDNHVLTLPRVHTGTAGLTFHASAQDQVDLSADYFRRRPTRDAISTIVTRDDAGAILTDRDRRQTGFDLESEAGLTGAYQHDFPGEDHQLRVEANASTSPQREPAHFVDHWRAPAQPDRASDVELRRSERQGHVTVEFTDPLDEGSKLEAGYALELHRRDIRSDADSLDVTQQFVVPDPSRTYRFKLDEAIQGAYATYQRTLGRLTLLAGLRAEYAVVSSDLVSGSTGFTDRYSGLYPTLHAHVQTSEHQELQLSYGRRIRRPDIDDLNPFPEFTDPYNMEAGNPRLRPESIQSAELGYRLRGDHFSFLPSLYYRRKTNGFTRVTQALSDTTFLRTPVNLARDQSAGFEPVLTLSARRALQANLNANVYYQRIDASNLGYSGTKSAVSWSGTANVNVTPWPGTMLEANANYRARRLTPQGNARPSFLLNVGARQNLYRDRISLTVAVSDLLKTQRQATDLDVAGTHQRVTTRRNAQIFYAGLTYHYGRPEKKEKEKGIQYEELP